MTKKIAFGPRPSASLPPSADSWIASRGGEPASAVVEKPAMKRLTGGRESRERRTNRSARSLRASQSIADRRTTAAPPHSPQARIP